MDCKLARERLDAARPDAQDREDVELLDAFAHLDDCPACADAVEFRRSFDRRLGAILRAVDIPADLKSRLVASLPAENTALRPDEASRPRPTRRRAFLAAASAAALLLVVGGVWWAGRRPPAPLTAETVLDWCRTELADRPTSGAAALDEFDGAFDATIADGRWTSVLQDRAPRGADLDGDGRHDAAVYVLGNGGYLVVLPPNRVNDPPAAGSAKTAPAQYSPAPHVAWTLDQQMYVCVLPDGTRSRLDALLQRVHRSAA